jgi:hypothetical protein
MDKEPQGEHPTQETRKGLTIPVPTRDEIESALAAVAKPQVSRLRRKRGTKQK